MNPEIPTRPGWYSEAAEQSLQLAARPHTDAARDEQLARAQAYATLETANALHRIADELKGKL